MSERAAIGLPVIPSQQQQQRRSACCPPGACAFRPHRVRSYIMIHIIATRAKESPSDLLDSFMREEAEQNSLVQYSSQPGSRGRLATDIMLSLEMASKRHRVPLAVSNHRKLADLLCPFSCEGDD